MSTHCQYCGCSDSNRSVHFAAKCPGDPATQKAISNAECRERTLNKLLSGSQLKMLEDASKGVIYK